MNETFGPLAFSHLPRVETPVGTKCRHCDEEIGASDSGVLMPYMKSTMEAEIVAFHRECHIRQIAGSVGHQRGQCSCDGGAGTLDDPPGVSKRVAALLAEREWMMRYPPANVGERRHDA